MIDGLDTVVEDQVRCLVVSWKAWKLHGGTGGVGNCLGFSEERMMTIDGNRDNYKAIIIEADCQRTDRAMSRMKSEDWKGWAALQHYHLDNVSKRACAKAARVHHREIDAILRRAHDNLLHFRKEDAYRAITINPAPVLA